MQVNEAAFIEKLMYGKCQGMANAKNGAECVRPETEVSYFPQEFKTVLLWLERKFFCVT